MTTLILILFFVFVLLIIQYLVVYKMYKNKEELYYTFSKKDWIPFYPYYDLIKFIHKINK